MNATRVCWRSSAPGRARVKITELVPALDGESIEHHARMCRHFLDEIDHLAQLVAVLDTRVAGIVTTLARDQDQDNLDTIPGIGRRPPRSSSPRPAGTWTSSRPRGTWRPGSACARA